MQRPTCQDVERLINEVWAGPNGDTNDAIEMRLKDLVRSLYTAGFTGTIKLELVVVHSTNDQRTVQEFRRTTETEIRIRE